MQAIDLFRRFRNGVKIFWHVLTDGSVIYNTTLTAAMITGDKSFYLSNNTFIEDDAQRFCTREELKSIYKSCTCGHTKTLIMAAVLGGK